VRKKSQKAVFFQKLFSRKSFLFIKLFLNRPELIFETNKLTKTKRPDLNSASFAAPARPKPRPQSQNSFEKRP